jgi:hypothetical protein
LSGSGQYGNIVVVVDNGLGSLSFDPITELIPIINGDPSQPTIYPGYRASGIQAWITRPAILTPSTITLTIKLIPTILDTADTITACETAISAYSTQLAIGGTMYLSEIIAACMGIEGIINVSNVKINGSAADLPATDVATRITVNTTTITVTTTY